MIVKPKEIPVNAQEKAKFLLSCSLKKYFKFLNVFWYLIPGCYTRAVIKRLIKDQKKLIQDQKKLIKDQKKLIKDQQKLYQVVSYIAQREAKEGYLLSGERQVSDSIENIEKSHVERYRHTLRYIADDSHVLDIACGVGYGSCLVSSISGVHVTGVDISQDAIDYAKKYYQKDNISYICKSADLFCTEPKFDFITSFESIEHIEDDKQFVKTLHAMLKVGGSIACSVPNQDCMPYDPKRFPFHIKHYTPKMFEILLSEAGFSSIEFFSHSKAKPSLVQGPENDFIIAYARKL